MSGEHVPVLPTHAESEKALSESMAALRRVALSDRPLDDADVLDEDPGTDSLARPSRGLGPAPGRLLLGDAGLLTGPDAALVALSPAATRPWPYAP